MAFFLLTVIYEWGYYRAIGPQFQSSVSATDYLTNAILWLPYSGLMLIILVDFRALKFYTGPSRITGTRRNWSLAVMLSVVILTFGAIAYFGRPTDMLPSIWAFTILWPLLFYLFFPTSTIASSAILYGIARALPPFVFAAFALGLQNGYDDLKTARDAYLLKTKQPAEERRIIVLRNLEKGILFRDVPLNRVELHRWDDVVSVSRLAIVASDSPFVCQRFGWNCPNVSMP